MAELMDEMINSENNYYNLSSLKDKKVFLTLKSPVYEREKCINSERAMAGIIGQGFKMLCKTHYGFSTLVVHKSQEVHGVAKGVGLIPGQPLIGYEILSMSPLTCGLNFPIYT